MQAFERGWAERYHDAKKTRARDGGQYESGALGFVGV